MGADASEAAPAGLRERKKQRTRGTLLRTAVELFTTRGYDETTIDDIARVVDVSQRTFFRHFASKEEVVFEVQRTVEAHFQEALRDRPAHEPPLDALRNAVLRAWDTLSEAISEVMPVELYLRTFQVIESTPTLLAAHLRRCMEMDEKIARLIADREGLDVDTDPRPRVAVAAFSGVMRITGQLWVRGEDRSMAGMRNITEAYLDRLGPALSTDWRKSATDRPGGAAGGQPGDSATGRPEGSADGRPGD
ncbi:TetR/AcrR family transcriptional regulator [Streptomyces sp. NPDC046887]|uniref:TetR/AcrR family transcriptional regulator n=1 Tax=Streptomyces sp. NPDC046887 TaxID=3155472 RepID=UPI0033C6068A